MSESLNMNALRIVEHIVDQADRLDCAVHVTENGTTVIDVGISVAGSHEAGRLVSEVCMGGLGSTRISRVSIGDIDLPAVIVGTNQPALATLGSQMAGWHMHIGDFTAMGSGPARALSGVEKELYSQLQYTDSATHAVLVLETRKVPTLQVTQSIADSCGIPCSNLYCIVVPSASLAGSVEAAARVVELGMKRLHRLDFDPRRIRTAYGVAAIAPVAGTDDNATGLANDCILYGGRVYLHVASEEGEDLNALVVRMPSSTSSQYGSPLCSLMKAIGYDRIDPALFSPAEVTLVDVRNETIHRAGSLNSAVLRASLEQTGLA